MILSMYMWQALLVGFVSALSVRQSPLSLASNAVAPVGSTISEPVAEGRLSDTLPTKHSLSAFENIAQAAAFFIVESDLGRHAIGQTDAPSATKWMDEKGAEKLRHALDQIKLKLPQERSGVDRDQSSQWIQFFKSVPSPAVVDFSEEFRQAVNQTLPAQVDRLPSSRDDLLQRMAFRLILLPSGTALPSPLVEFIHSLIYGKLLYGGVERSRLLPSSKGVPRAAGVSQQIKGRVNDNPPSWMMFGGTNRMYQAVDMGAAALLEVVVAPQGEISVGNNMIFKGLTWSPQDMLDYVSHDESSDKDNDAEASRVLSVSAASLSGRDRNDAFRSEFTSSVGGLQKEIDVIVRRVLDGRVIRPADKVLSQSAQDDISRDLSLVAMEAEELALLGLTPVRGLLLYGPPGTGKTLLAREISRALRARAPKIVSAPELLDRWVGGSEKLVRALFSDAISELAVHNGDASKSALHVVVIDEIDAVFRKRTSSEDTGEATRASVVNQILSCLDGVNSIPNVLMIGLTNRRELLDEALLRPGRLEVQLEIGLPDCEGRREILKIHFGALRERGRLSLPLCCAIDGTEILQDDSQRVEESSVSSQRWRRRLRQLTRKRSYDLAVATAGFSGADIAGLVRSAGSLALSRARRDGSGVEGLLITLDDVKQALLEVKR